MTQCVLSAEQPHLCADVPLPACQDRLNIMLPGETCAAAEKYVEHEAGLQVSLQSDLMGNDSCIFFFAGPFPTALTPPGLTQ